MLDSILLLNEGMDDADNILDIDRASVLVCKESCWLALAEAAGYKLQKKNSRNWNWRLGPKNDT